MMLIHQSTVALVAALIAVVMATPAAGDETTFRAAGKISTSFGFADIAVGDDCVLTAQIDKSLSCVEFPSQLQCTQHLSFRVEIGGNVFIDTNTYILTIADASIEGRPDVVSLGVAFSVEGVRFTATFNALDSTATAIHSENYGLIHLCDYDWSKFDQFWIEGSQDRGSMTFRTNLEAKDVRVGDGGNGDPGPEPGDDPTPDFGPTKESLNNLVTGWDGDFESAKAEVNPEQDPKSKAVKTLLKGQKGLTGVAKKIARDKLISALGGFAKIHSTLAKFSADLLNRFAGRFTDARAVAQLYGEAIIASIDLAAQLVEQAGGAVSEKVKAQYEDAVAGFETHIATDPLSSVKYFKDLKKFKLDKFLKAYLKALAKARK